MSPEIEKRLSAIEGMQEEIVIILRQLFQSNTQLDLKLIARKVAIGDRQALKEFNEHRKTMNDAARCR
jgi:hypothetical protein